VHRYFPLDLRKIAVYTAIWQHCTQGIYHCCQPAENSAKQLKTGRKKKEIGRGNWRPYSSHFLTKEAENRPKKIFYEIMVLCMKFFLYEQLLQ
jgi:hypothetical protein